MVPQYRNLGVYFEIFLSFSTPANILAESALRALGRIISNDIFEPLFNTGVVPIMDYCAGYYDSGVINNIQNRAMRYFLGVNKFTPTHALYGELGWVMPRYRRWLSFAQLWNRLILMNDNRITKKILLWDRRICCNNWSSEVFEILNECGLEHCFFFFFFFFFF